MAKIKFFNAFVLKKNINATTSGLAEDVPLFPGIPNNPTGTISDYPLFPTSGNSATGRTATTSNKNWIIEESRVRGGYNNTEVGYGVRAYLKENSSEQTRRNNALIYSGLYNSITDFNETNVFPTGEEITKSVDPINGSIQKIHALDSNLAIFQENKVSSALIDKDAIYSAEGVGTPVSSTKLVIGQITPYVGEYGISRNPESFAYYGYRRYFADKYRNSVMRLSRDGLTEISQYGMSDFFRDQFGDLNDDFKPFTFTGSITSLSSSPAKLTVSGSNDLVHLNKGMLVTIPQASGSDLTANIIGIVNTNILYLSNDPGNVFTILQITTNQTNFTDGTYTGTVGSTVGYTTSGSGSSMVLSIVVLNNTVVSATTTQLGTNFSVSDTITVAGTSLGSNNQSLVLTITSIKNQVITATFTKYIKDRIIGGWDSHDKNYVLSIQDKSENITTNDEYYTLTFEDDINGWTSFHSYEPNFVASLKNKYYSFFDSEIYEHYDSNSIRSSYYGVTYNSSIDFIFNASPSIIKNFKTVNYEGSNGWQVETFLSDAEGFDLQSGSQQQFNDSAKQIKSYDEGLYTDSGIPYRAGFNRKENKYFANLINNSAARPNEVFFGDATTGIKGYLATVKVSTDATTDPGGAKELFAVSTEFVVSSR